MKIRKVLLSVLLALTLAIIACQIGVPEPPGIIQIYDSNSGIGVSVGVDVEQTTPAP